MIQQPRKVKDDKNDKVIVEGFPLRSRVGSVTMTLRW